MLNDITEEFVQENTDALEFRAFDLHSVYEIGALLRMITRHV